MHLDFMTPEVWNGLVIGVILIGAAFAVLRLLRDWNRHQLRQRQSDRWFSDNRSDARPQDDGKPRL